MSFTCDQCFDTETIDFGGREIPCPSCSSVPVLEFTITGLGHGLGKDGSKYETALRFSSSTLTFRGTRSEILNDVIRVRRSAEFEASRQRLTGRNYISSGAIAIEKHVRKALAS